MIKKIQHSLLILIGLVISNNLFAQTTGIIKGIISGPQELTNIAINLVKSSNNSVVKTTLCNADGSFEFEPIKIDTYFIVIKAIGFEMYKSDSIVLTVNKPSIQLATVKLQVQQNQLAEVQVTTKKQFVERKIDRVVINPDALIGNAGATALEILEKAPSVLVDLNGNISLKGNQGVIIFIDDKPTYLSSTDLTSYLRSLPAGLVESIEIMVTPPAKYDAAGNAGIINIKLKKTKTIGINGGINLSYGQGRYARTNNSINFNYRINKLNFFSNFGVSQNNSFQDLTIKRLYYNNDGSYQSGFSQKSYLKREMRGNNIRIGIDYYANNKTTIGVVLAGFISPSFSPIENNATITDNSNIVVNKVVATNPTERKWKNGSINFNYNYKLGKKGQELSANADYIIYNSTVSQNLTNNVFTANSSLVSSSTLQSSLPADITIKSIKVDYTHPLNNGVKLDAGTKYSWVYTDNIANFYDLIGSIATPNYQFSNRFKYKEQITAAYLNFSKDWKKISIQTGLRFENTNITGNQLGNSSTKDSSFAVNYGNLFPTFFIAYRIDSLNKHQLGLSIGRRINRPNYQDMNPFTYPLDRFTYYAGNPFLQPTFSYNIEFSYTYKNRITTTLDYSISSNLIQETNEQQGNIFYSRPGNFGKQIAYGIGINAMQTITKWWTLQLYTEYKNLTFQSTIYNQQLDESRFYWYFGPTNQFVINSKLSAELAGTYQTSVLVGQFLTIPIWQARLGLSHKILKNKGSVKLNLSDIFYTNQPGGEIRNIENAKANWLSFLDSRVISIAFSYRFNKGKTLNTRQSGAADTEKSRVKTS